jgi:two-component system, LuxR family, response regulator FixJ
MTSLETGPRPLVAVVEDDRAVLNSLEFALQAQGYHVCAFESAARAGDSDEIMESDCIVVDYAMPGLSGVELLAKLRTRGLTCPAIVIASNPHAKCRREVLAAGASLIEKPLIGDGLLGHIRRGLTASDERRLG